MIPCLLVPSPTKCRMCVHPAQRDNSVTRWRSMEKKEFWLLTNTVVNRIQQLSDAKQRQTMEPMTPLQLAELRTVANEATTQHDASVLIVADLRRYCLKDDIAASDGELFAIAEAAVAGQLSRARTDRRKVMARQRVRRKIVRRTEGLEALAAKFKRFGLQSRRWADRRNGGDCREIVRRAHVRRIEDR